MPLRTNIATYGSVPFRSDELLSFLNLRAVGVFTSFFVLRQWPRSGINLRIPERFRHRRITDSSALGIHTPLQSLMLAEGTVDAFAHKHRHIRLCPLPIGRAPIVSESARGRSVHVVLRIATMASLWNQPTHNRALSPPQDN